MDVAGSRPSADWRSSGKEVAGDEADLRTGLLTRAREARIAARETVVRARELRRLLEGREEEPSRS